MTTSTIDFDKTQLVRAKRSDPDEPGVGDPIDHCNDAITLQWHWFGPEDARRFRVLAAVIVEDELFIADTPSLPGAASQGETLEDALDQLREAVCGCVESYVAAGESVPWVREARVDQPEQYVYTGWIDVDV